jgi:hypothetical protein
LGVLDQQQQRISARLTIDMRTIITANLLEMGCILPACCRGSQGSRSKEHPCCSRALQNSDYKQPELIPSMKLPRSLRNELAMMKIRSILDTEIENIVGRPVAGLGTGENIMSYLEAESGLNKKQLDDLIDNIQLTDADLRKAKLLQYEIFSKEIRAQNNEIRKRFGVPEKSRA